MGEAEEPHATFVENALAKARHAAVPRGCAAIADDSGLCVDALGGAPGVDSAHYAPLARERRESSRSAGRAPTTRCCSSSCADVPDRRAHFVCTLVALRAADDPEPLVAVGRWGGEIVAVPRGNGGFGYDPLMFLLADGRDRRRARRRREERAQPPRPRAAPRSPGGSASRRGRAR